VHRAEPDGNRRGDASDTATGFWPPAGASLVATIVVPMRRWAWVLAGIVMPVVVGFVLGMMSLRPALWWAWPSHGPRDRAIALQRFRASRWATRERLMIAFLMIAVVVSPLLSPVIGTIGTVREYHRRWFGVWISWAVGDGLRVLLVLPLLMTYTAARVGRRTRRELAALTGAVVLAAALAFVAARAWARAPPAMAPHRAACSSGPTWRWPAARKRPVSGSPRSTCTGSQHAATGRHRGRPAGAIARNELTVHYQPLMNLSNGTLWASRHWCAGRIDGSVERVRRVHHGRRAIRLVGLLGDWVLGAACLQLATWRDTDPQHHHDGVPMAVNVSARQRSDRALPQRVRTLLDELPLAAGPLKIEITDSGFWMDFETALTVMGDLRAAGVKVSLEDSGTRAT
jgi:hypothetical protein